MKKIFSKLTSNTDTTWTVFAILGLVLWGFHVWDHAEFTAWQMENR